MPPSEMPLRNAGGPAGEPPALLKVIGLYELTSLWTHRRVLTSLARHDLRRAYAGTAAGLAWSVLTPLLPLLLFSIIFSFGLRLPLGRAPYIYGFAAAYVPWVLLSGAITGAASSIVDYRHLVKKVVFPLEIIPADRVLVHSLPHAILVTLTSAACTIGGYGGFSELLAVGYFYVCAVVLAISCGLFLSGLAVLVRDVQQVLPAFLNVWFWITPIAWAATRLPPGGRTLLALNPASYVVTGYRYALMPKVFAAPTAAEGAVFWIVSILMLVVGSSCFRRLRAHFWDCL
jgi:teichoic acid transport system permease protein